MCVDRRLQGSPSGFRNGSESGRFLPVDDALAILIGNDYRGNIVKLEPWLE
jgi:hypothetical protein